MFGVVSGVGDTNGRHSNRDPDEIVIVEIEKVPVPGHVVLAGAPAIKTVPIVGDRYKIPPIGPLWFFASPGFIARRMPGGGLSPHPSPGKSDRGTAVLPRA